MLRMRIRSVGDNQAHCCLTVVNMLNELGVTVTGSRFLPDKSWSLLAVPNERPLAFIPSAVSAFRRKLDPVVTILSAEIEPYLESFGGEIYCARCCIVADYSEEKGNYHCKLCGDTILVQGGGTHDRR